MYTYGSLPVPCLGRLWGLSWSGSKLWLGHTQEHEVKLDRLFSSMTPTVWTSLNCAKTHCLGLQHCAQTILALTLECDVHKSLRPSIIFPSAPLQEHSSVSHWTHMNLRSVWFDDKFSIKVPCHDSRIKHRYWHYIKQHCVTVMQYFKVDIQGMAHCSDLPFVAMLTAVLCHLWCI